MAYLQHVQKSRLSGIIEAEKEEFGVLVEQTEGGEDVPDYTRVAILLAHAFS